MYFTGSVVTLHIFSLTIHDANVDDCDAAVTINLKVISIASYTE